MSRRQGSLPATVFEPFDRRHWLVLAVVTLVAMVLRCWQLGEWSLWVDEAHTWRDATMRLDGERGFLHTDRVFYPITPVLLRFLFGVGWLGYDEASLRLPFALFGIVTVPLMAVCGRRLIGAWPAVVAAGMLAVNPWHVFWSQNARGYVLVVLLAVVAIHRAHVWLATDRPRDLIAAALALAIGAMSHPTALLLACGFLGFLILRRTLLRVTGRRRVLWLACTLLFLLLGLPWVIKHYSPFQDFLRAKGSPSLMHFVETVAYYFRPTTLLLAASGLWFAPRALGRDRTLLLGCMVVIPFLVLTAVGGQLVKVTARYAICTLPVLTWLMALGCQQVARSAVAATSQPRVVRLALAALLPVLMFGEYGRLDVAYFGGQHGQRARWREAAEFVRELAGDRDLRVLTVSQPTLRYYLRRRYWFVTEEDPHPDVDVLPLVHWLVESGVMEFGPDKQEKKLHEPGAEAHLAWHKRCAEGRRALFAFMVTLPALREQDRYGELAVVLARDFELALHLPCWVGPKDESVYVYVPK